MLKNELPGLYMTVQFDSLGLPKSRRKISKENKALVSEIGVLHKTVSEEQLSKAVVKKKLTNLRSSNSVFDEFAARLAESDKALEAARAEVTSLNVAVVRADTEKAVSEEMVAEVLGDVEQHMMRLNIVVADQNRSEMSTRLLVTELISAVDSAPQHVGYDAVNGLQIWLERAYSTICVHRLVAPTVVYGMLSTSICWKGEKRREQGAKVSSIGI